MNKLGQLLVTRGWITVQQLTRALKNQQVVGGRLGTCLLEMEALTEDLLVKGLSEQLGVPPAAIDDLRSVPEDVLATLSPKVARRCRAVPFRVAGARADVAMLEPRNLTAQDELAFASSKRIKVHVLHEARIFEALDRYYGEEAPSRLTHILERLNRSRYLWEREPEIPEPPQPPLLTMPAGILTAAPMPSAPAPPPLRTRPVAVPADAPWPRPVPAPPPAAAAAEPEAQPRPAVVPRPPAANRVIHLTAEERAAIGAGPSVPPAAATLADLETGFAATSSRDEVGRLLLAHLARLFLRVALFQVTRERVTGWMAQGAGIDVKRFARFAVGFDQASLFLNLRQGSGVHLGPLPPMAAHRELAACWGGDLPRACIMLPVRLRDRLVTVIYADGGGAQLGRVDLEALQRVAAATAAALERCILAKKRGGGSGAFGTV